MFSCILGGVGLWIGILSLFLVSLEAQCSFWTFRPEVLALGSCVALAFAVWYAKSPLSGETSLLSRLCESAALAVGILVPYLLQAGLAAAL